MSSQQWRVWLLTLTLLGCSQIRSSTPNQKMVENNMLRGVEYMKLGKYDIALERLNEALTLDPNYAEAHGAIAVLHEQLGQFEEAQNHYEQALTFKPNDSNIHNNYGQFLCKRGQGEEADKHFLKAVANPLYRTPYIPYTNAAICAFLYQHNDTKAVTYLHKALEIQPKFEMALYWMTKLSYEQGFHQQAQEYLKRYLEVGRPTPELLCLGIQIERALHHSEAENYYATLLHSQYPDSEAACRLP